MPHQRKNNTGRYNHLTVLLPLTAAIFTKKQPSQEPGEETSLDFHLAMIKKIDLLLSEHPREPASSASLSHPPVFPHPPTPIEPRLPLSRTMNHCEITWQPTLTPPQMKPPATPDEFKTELTLHPEFKFITSQEFADVVIRIKPRPEDRVEIIDLSHLNSSTTQPFLGMPLTKQGSSEKQTTLFTKEPPEQHNKKTEIIDARSLKQKTYEDAFLAALKQNEDIERKSKIYYLNSKDHRQKKLEVKQTYIPVDFEQRSKELHEQQQKEQQRRQEEEEKIKKQLEHEHEKLEKLETKKAKLEEKKHEHDQKEKKEPLRKEHHPEPEHLTKQSQKEQKRLQRLQARKQRIEERLQRKKEKQTQKEHHKQQLLKQKGKNKKTPLHKKEKTTGFSFFKKQQPVAPSAELDDDLKKVLLMTDTLLGELPEDIINKFAQSEDFELYERVLNKYKIK